MATSGGRPPWKDVDVRRAFQRLSALFWRARFKANGECPVCSAPVVLFPATYTSHNSGPMTVRRTREELVAACPVHGRSPFNDLSLKASNTQ